MSRRCHVRCAPDQPPKVHWITTELAEQASERNLRRALLILETCHVAQTPLQAQQPLQLPDWELYIQARGLPFTCLGPWPMPKSNNGASDACLGHSCTCECSRDVRFKCITSCSEVPRLESREAGPRMCHVVMACAVTGLYPDLCESLHALTLAGSLMCGNLCSANGAQEIAGLILKEQSPKRLFEVRGKLYELLVNCIPAELILRRMATELLPKLDDELKHKLVEHAAFFEHRLQARPRQRLLACPASCMPWPGSLAPEYRNCFDCVRKKHPWPGVLIEDPAPCVSMCVLLMTWLSGRRCCAGGPEGNYPFGGFRSKVHERLQGLDHQCPWLNTGRCL